MIRKLYPWEKELIVPLVRSFHAEAKIGSEFSSERLLATLASTQHTVIGMFADEGLVGVLIALKVPQILTTAWLAQEMVWYIHPEHRGTREAVLMFDVFEQWAADQKVYAISVANLTDGNPTILKFYAQRGYRNIETHHLKILP